MPNVETVTRTNVVEWQSDEALGEAEPRMLAMQGLVGRYELPLLNALEDEYREKIEKRGWLVCGPASIVLANLISEDTGLPLIPNCQDRKKECLQLEIYMFNEYDKTASGKRIDHTNLQYHTGTGFSMTIDVAYNLLWSDAQKEPGVTLFEYHEDYQVHRDMYDFYNLSAVCNLTEWYTERRKGWPDLWGTKPSERSKQDYRDMIRIMHSPLVYEDMAQTHSGNVFEVEGFWGQRLVRVYEAVRQEIPAGSLDASLWKSEQDAEKLVGATALSGQMLY